MSLATYPDSSNGDDKVYLNYFTADQITAGTNSANKQLYWDAPNNALYANAFVGSLSGNASSASVAASVSDYNSASEPIYIGYRGDGLTSCEYLAAYGTTSSGARCIKDISPSNVTVGSANYATSAGNSDTVDGMHVASSGKWGTIPSINSSDGVTEVGHYIDFHADSSASRDFDGRIRGDAGGGELVIPSKSGTIAVTSDIPTKTSQLTNDSGYKTSVSVSNKDPTLSWGSRSTIGTVDGNSLTVVMPSNPNTNYYPNRIYTSGFQLTNYTGSTACQLYIPVATWTTQGVYVAPCSDTISINLKYGNNVNIGSCTWTSMSGTAGYYLRIPADHGGTSSGASSQITYLIWFKLTSSLADDRWFRVDLGSDSYKVLSAQATPIKTNLSGYGIGLVTNCSYSSSRYCYIGVDELNSCSGIDVLLIARYGS